MPRRPLLLPILLPFALIACGKTPYAPRTLDSLDRELTDANAASPAHDPALTAALHDQIMVDPALAQTSNADVIRPPSRPDPMAVPPTAARADPVDPAKLKTAPAASGDCPDCELSKGALTLGALGARQPSRPLAQCAPLIAYSAGWSNRLPQGLGLYPDARVEEAAGTDGKGCSLRIVSFASGAAPARVMDWYFTQARAAGFTAEHRADEKQDVLAGTRGGTTYILYLSRRPDGGTDVDLIANG
ncbi:hypothetical protein [Sphingomonas bacterium]|uniref:hypothetical protein n=1 Tax=Sphingomonas bacterium TaxID=1895847 RepID=UPI0015774E3B|nr:hypothetical protein [Sphingomonas bacterium]